MKYASNLFNFQWFRKIPFIILVIAVLLFQRDVTPYSDLRVWVAPYSFSIERWVAKNILAKSFFTIEMASKTFPQEISNKKSFIDEFFHINQQIRNMRNSLSQLSISDQRQFTEENLESLNEIDQEQIIKITQLIQKRKSIKNYAEFFPEEDSQ